MQRSIDGTFFQRRQRGWFLRHISFRNMAFIYLFIYVDVDDVDVKPCYYSVVFCFSYVPWNLHEEVMGHFNFEGGLDIA